MKYKAAIFDLDGTLLDTLEDLADAVNHTMDEFGFERHTIAEVRAYVGNGVGQLIARCIPGGEKNPKFSDALEEYRRYYSLNSEIKTKPYDGIIELIEKLKKSGVNAAVVSNKIHAASVTLCRKYFPGIEAVNGEREAEGVRRKPYPDMVLKTIEQLGLTPDECVYIGDSEVDIETANNAGIDCISVLWGFRDRDYLEQKGGKRFVSSADELYHAITD